MARQRDQSPGYSGAIDWLLSDDFYASENIWQKFDIITPPSSPEPELEDFDDCFLESSLPFPATKLDIDIQDEDCLFKFMTPEARQNLKSKLIQDCMWSGSDEEHARMMRSRKVSLSELTMQTASTSCVDPTTFTAYPRQQNQLEHSYSLTTPEPMKFPTMMMYTPDTTDDDSGSEGLIDVVTVDTKSDSSKPEKAEKKPKIITHTQFKVHNNLKAVAERLNCDSLKRPKCMYDDDYELMLPSKKQKKCQSAESSQSGSDTEDFEGKRSAHNVMERIRRNDLKKSLIKLRNCVPSLESHSKPSKVKILTHATEYVKNLQKHEAKMQAESKSLALKNQNLKDRLNFLQSQANFLMM